MDQSVVVGRWNRACFMFHLLFCLSAVASVGALVTKHHHIGVVTGSISVTAFLGLYICASYYFRESGEDQVIAEMGQSDPGH